MNPRIKQAIVDGAKQGALEGLADLRSRLFAAGVLIGLSSGLGAWLYVGSAADRGSVVAMCIACGVLGVALFSLPSRAE